MLGALLGLASEVINALEVLASGHMAIQGPASDPRAGQWQEDFIGYCLASEHNAFESVALDMLLSVVRMPKRAWYYCRSASVETKMPSIFYQKFTIVLEILLIRNTGCIIASIIFGKIISRDGKTYKSASNASVDRDAGNPILNTFGKAI